MFDAVIAAIDQAETIIIHRHQNPDPDAFGAQFGLATLLKTNYPDKTIYAVGEANAGLAWIGSPDQITDATYHDALVIVVDTANLARIADSRYSKGTRLIKLDHHPDREPFGDISVVDTHMSSTSELLVSLAEAAHWVLNAEAARCLYAGIIGDTGRFMFDLTTPDTLIAAAKLMRTGIDAPAIARHEDQLAPNIAALIGSALTHTQVTPAGAGSYTVTAALRDQYHVALGDEQLAVNYIGRLTTIRAWIMFTERPDGQYRCELRSKEIPINQLAVAHGGGGHPLASGAVAKDAKACQQMCAELDTLLRRTLA